MSALIDQPAFRALLPWAKAWAQAEGSGELSVRHVLLAAAQRTAAGELALPGELPLALARYASTHAASAAAPAQPVDIKLPLAADLKMALASATSDWAAWLVMHAHLPPTSRPASPPALPSAEVAMPMPDDPVLATLRPWLVGAARVLGRHEVSAEAVAMALQAALRAGALDEQVGFAHWVEGHLDELTDWLALTGQPTDGVQPTLDDTPLALHQTFHETLSRLDPREHMPTTLWKWAQAAVHTANEERRQVQVAYHEAGHAVALHVLSPESVFTTITIQPEGNTGGYVASARNTGFEKIYMHSLEQALESIVVALAGRAAEVRQFGVSRADSGAVSDIQKATTTAWTAITSFGLDPDMGMVSLAAVQKLEADTWVMPMAGQGWLHDLAQQRLHAWLRWGQAEADALTHACWPLIDALARALLQHKTLDNDRTRAILGRWHTGGPPYQLRPLPTQYPPLP